MDTITIDKAGEIDMEYENATDGAKMLRIASYRKVTLLTIPMNASAPTYQYHRHDPETGEYAPAYYHTAGPTLAEWYEARQAAFNAAQEQQADEWADIRAAKRAKRAAARNAAAAAAELEGVLQAEYRDDYETRRDLRSAAVQ